MQTKMTESICTNWRSLERYYKFQLIGTAKNYNNPLGATAFLVSVDFTAFTVNVKTMALGKYLYQFGHAIWLAYYI